MYNLYVVSNSKKLVFPSILILLIYIIKELNYLYYQTIESPDFQEYFVYFQYLFGNIESTGREQGLFYYYIQSWHYWINYRNVPKDLNFVYLHKNIQEVNFYLYIIGLVGYYKLFKYFKFKNSSIICTLIFINFFPVSIVTRLNFKPEILAFAAIPWIIYLFEKFIKERNKLDLICSIPFLLIGVSSKGSIFAMFGVFFTIFYLIRIYKTNKKFVTILIFIFLFFLTLLSYENIKSNGLNIFELESGATNRSNYDYKASIDVIYKINLYKTITSPVKHNHSNSFLSITLLDTFGDYFDLYWNNDASQYFKNRKKIVNFETSGEIKGPKISFENNNLTFYLQKNTEIYLRSFIGLFISIFFYYYLIKFIYKKNKYSKLLLGTFIGALIILLHVITGFPTNNFDPSVGDSFKTLYYSYFLILSAAFLLIQIFEKNYLSRFLLIPYCLIVLFLLGFPKEPDPETNIYLEELNKTSTFCEINKIFIERDFQNLLDKCNSEVNLIENNKSRISNYSNLEQRPRFKLLNSITFFTLVLSFLYQSVDKKIYLKKNR